VQIVLILHVACRPFWRSAHNKRKTDVSTSLESDSRLAARRLFYRGSRDQRPCSRLHRAEYRRWGYPDWFHFVTGALELATAALLVVTATRLLGAGLGGAVMLAAAGT